MPNNDFDPDRSTFPIAMLAPGPFPTGQGTQVVIRGLAQGLARHGWPVHLVTYGSVFSPRIPRVRKPSHPGSGLQTPEVGLQVHRARSLPVGRRSGPHPLRPLADLALVSRALAVVRTRGCRVLHAHHVEGLAAGLLVRARCPKIRVIYHAHTALGPELPTYFSSRWSKTLAARAGTWFDRSMPRRADSVVVFDEAHRSFYRGCGVSEPRMHTIPPAIETVPFPSASLALRNHWKRRLGPGPWIVYAGNPDPYQNLPLLLAAFAKVSGQASPAKLLLLSHAPARRLNSLVRGQPGVVVHRCRGMDDLGAVLSLARLGVVPRTLWSGVPVKLINFLAAGVPVVACRSVGREMLTDQTGFAVEPDPDSFAAGILAGLRAHTFCRSAIVRSAQRFLIEGQMSRYAAIYRGLTGAGER